MPARPGRARVDTGSAWEHACGFSRAVRIGERILVGGTTATDAAGRVVCPGDVEGQMTFILDKITATLAALDADIDDVVRTRIYMADAARWPEAARCHARVFKDALPANTLVEIAGLVGDYPVEVEVEAITEPGAGPPGRAGNRP